MIIGRNIELIINGKFINMDLYERTKYFLNGEIQESNVDEVWFLLKEHSRLYYIEEAPIISDYEYDMLLKKLRSTKWWERYANMIGY